MKKTVTLLTVLLALFSISFAQTRTITRGAVPGELYMTTEWYGIDNGWGYDTLRYALLHITEHGKKAEIVYSCNYLDRDKMQPEVVLADATEGVVYIHDQYMKNLYIYDRLWFSNDYGNTWEQRDEPEYDSRYYVSNFEGLIYRGGGGVYKSINYGEIFSKMDGASYKNHSELGWEEEEVFAIGIIEVYNGILTHTFDFNRTYTLAPIDSQFICGNINGFFPDVFRGGLPGEIYITSRFPDQTWKASFSADTGYHFRVVYHSNPQPSETNLQFMSDRKAGDFYIIQNSGRIWTNEPYGFYTRICIEYYTHYGETLVGVYCYDLTREGIITAVEERKEESGVDVYPNPTSGELRITNYELRIKDVEVFDVYGRKQKAEGRRQNVIDLSDLSVGIYFMRITTDKGVTTKKIIKK